MTDDTVIVVDLTGLQTGNDDLADSSQWSPPTKQETPPLPVYPLQGDLP